MRIIKRMTLGTETSPYSELLARHQPRPIRTDEEADAVAALLDELLDKQELTEDEEDFRDLLGALVFFWEDGRYELPESTPLERIRALMADNGLRQRDLVPAVFPTDSVASEVLSGKRSLTYDFVARLARFFDTSPALFFPASTAVEKLVDEAAQAAPDAQIPTRV